jgi:hypothetical protein
MLALTLEVKLDCCIGAINKPLYLLKELSGSGNVTVIHLEVQLIILSHEDRIGLLYDLVVLKGIKLLFSDLLDRLYQVLVYFLCLCNLLSHDFNLALHFFYLFGNSGLALEFMILSLEKKNLVSKINYLFLLFRMVSG